MSVEPTRDPRADDRRAPDLPDTTAPPPNDAPSEDVHELPRNEAFRHGVVGGPPAERDEARPVRGPSADARTGRVVTDGETVADDLADADATDRNAARADDPDGI